MNTTVWLISFTDSNNKRTQTVHTHNCVADFRVIDKNATAQEIDCAIVAELVEAVREYRAELRKPIGCGTYDQVVNRVDAALTNIRGDK
jgi:hypothetical protein